VTVKPTLKNRSVVGIDQKLRTCEAGSDIRERVEDFRGRGVAMLPAQEEDVSSTALQV
jgi:hypothetical protein